MKPIHIVSCTQLRAIDRYHTQLVKSYNDLASTCKLNLVPENKEKLPVVYNQYIDKTEADIILFVHDDVYIDDVKLQEKLYEATKHYDVVGLAGCVEPALKHPALWHLMAGDQRKLRGAVAHSAKPNGLKGVKEDCIHVTSFGPTPSRVSLLDGLFIAMNVKKVREAGVRFDENNPALAHHYDLDFSMSCNKAKLKMGVWPIHVIHDSPGLNSLENEQWKQSNQWFLDKWTK